MQRGVKNLNLPTKPKTMKQSKTNKTGKRSHAAHQRLVRPIAVITDNIYRWHRKVANRTARTLGIKIKIKPSEWGDDLLMVEYPKSVGKRRWTEVYHRQVQLLA